MIADTYLSLNAPIQMAAPVLLHSAPRFRSSSWPACARNLAELDSQLAREKGLIVWMLKAAGMRFFGSRATRPDEDLAIELLEKHDVYVHPGHFYDFPGDGYLVVSLITPEQDFREGVGRVVLAV